MKQDWFEIGFMDFGTDFIFMNLGFDLPAGYKKSPLTYFVFV